MFIQFLFNFQKIYGFNNDANKNSGGYIQNSGGYIENSGGYKVPYKAHTFCSDQNTQNNGLPMFAPLADALHSRRCGSLFILLYLLYQVLAYVYNDHQ